MFFAILAAAATASSPSIAPLTRDLEPLNKGTVGFEFALPGGLSAGAPTVGVTYFLADNLAARLDFGLDAVLAPSGTPATFSIGLGLRMYQLHRGPVALYLSPQFIFGRAFIPGPFGGAQDAAEFVTFAGAVGAEYFFNGHLSAGGQLGLGLTFGSLGAPNNIPTRTELSTATSRLFANLYF